MRDFLWGALTMSSATAALFFFHYWRTTRDRLFVYFALAFVCFAANWAALSLIDPDLEVRHNVYLIRLVGFVLIVVGVIDKNRRVLRGARDA